jgi:hypothetical protein
MDGIIMSYYQWELIDIKITENMVTATRAVCIDRVNKVMITGEECVWYKNNIKEWIIYPSEFECGA